MCETDTLVIRLVNKLIKLRRPKDLRRIIYDRMMLENNGKVPCYICENHVMWKNSTLEHIIPKCQGGTDVEYNLSISHPRCNVEKGGEIKLVKS